MFIRMIAKAFLRQWKNMAMIAFTIALGASLATAMLSVMMDVEDKMNQELKAYGANIKVVPKEASVINELYDVGDENVSGTYLREDELGKIKTIFWAFNIVDFTPFLDTTVTLPSGQTAEVVGTWFNHHLSLPTGEELDAGVSEYECVVISSETAVITKIVTVAIVLVAIGCILLIFVLLSYKRSKMYFL